MNKKTVYTLISVFIVFVIAAVIKVSFFNSNDSVNLEADKENATANSGYIKLPDNPNQATKLIGKVITVNSSDNSKASHKLLDENWEIIAFLISEDDKLKLAEGRVVEITGEIEKSTTSEFILLKVTAISFK